MPLVICKFSKKPIETTVLAEAIVSLNASLFVLTGTGLEDSELENQFFTTKQFLHCLDRSNESLIKNQSGGLLLHFLATRIV